MNSLLQNNNMLAALTAGTGITVTTAGGAVTVAADLKANGGLVIEASELAIDLGASSITGTLAVGDGGTGLTALTTQADNTATTATASTAFAKAQDAVLAREPDQGVALTAAAIAAMKVTHSATFSSTTNNAGYGGVFACPSWTPAATQVLLNKWAADVGYKLELILTSGIFRLTLNDTVYDSTVPGDGAASNLLAGSHHSILAAPTVGATTTTVSFFIDGVLLNTTAAQTNEDVTNTQDLYVGGTSAVTYAMTVYDVYHFILAPSAAEWRLAYLEGIPESWKWGSQTELMPNQVDRDFSGASAWANGNFNAYGETGDLSLTATAAGQYCRLPVASAPTTATKKYRLTFDVANIVSTFNFYEYAGGSTPLFTVTANGAQSKEFTAVGVGGLFIEAATDTSSADFDNFSLVQIGATLALTPESWQSDKPYDCSSNALTCAYPATGWSLTRRVGGADRIGAYFDGGGTTAIAENTKAVVTVPYNCTIVGGQILASKKLGTSGVVTISVDIWREATATNYDGGSSHPAVADSICAAAIPTVTAANRAAIDPSTWGAGATLAQGDILVFNANTITDAVVASVALYVNKR